MKKELIKFAAFAAFVALILAVLAIGGYIDIDNERMKAEAYCDRVQLGLHRDFNDNIDCGELSHD